MGHIDTIVHTKSAFFFLQKKEQLQNFIKKLKQQSKGDLRDRETNKMSSSKPCKFSRYNYRYCQVLRRNRLKMVFPCMGVRGEGTEQHVILISHCSVLMKPHDSFVKWFNRFSDKCPHLINSSRILKTVRQIFGLDKSTI